MIILFFSLSFNNRKTLYIRNSFESYKSSKDEQLMQGKFVITTTGIL